MSLARVAGPCLAGCGRERIRSRRHARAGYLRAHPPRRGWAGVRTSGRLSGSVWSADDASPIPGGVTTFSAVVTTGIYCRPGCGATPLADNVRTFELAAAAEAAGYRACLRCRPYRVAGPLPWDAPELVCRAVQLIIDGVLDEGREAALAERLAISPRHLRRLFSDHLGLTPGQLARSRRAHFARRLLDDSDLTMAEVAFASGFGSLRQFNREMREVFRASPRELRSRRRRADRLAADGGLTMRLPFEPSYAWDATLAFLDEHIVPGVESVQDGVYRRTISLDGGPGVLEVHSGGADYLLMRAHLPYWEGLIHVVERAGRMVGIDGTAIPGTWAPLEVAVHAVLTQLHGPDDARHRLDTLVQTLGIPVPGLSHDLTHLFPSTDALARAETATVRELANAVANRTVVLDGSARYHDLVTALTAVSDIEPATAHRIAARLAVDARRKSGTGQHLTPDRQPIRPPMERREPRSPSRLAAE
jgi:AraC family transcriptional regulator of adaptative response / DNA-3-methyladenine glycosylase II